MKPSAALVLAAVVLPEVAAANEAWRQWGGPHRNFKVEGVDLPESWPEGGPVRIWERPLGEGHSTIAVDEGRVFTLYRPRLEAPDAWADEEVVICLDAGTGATIWEHRYPSRPLDFQFGAGPHATPLIVGDMVYRPARTNRSSPSTSDRASSCGLTTSWPSSVRRRRSSVPR